MPGPLDLLRNRPGLADWIAVSRQTVRLETYFTTLRTEAERRCEEAAGLVTVFKDGAAGRGRATFAITPGRQKSFEADFEQAMYQAGLGGEPAYPVAAKEDYTKVVLLDPDARDSDEFMARRARSEILSALAETPGVKLAGIEFFVSKTKTSVVTSRGAAAENDVSTCLLDLVLLAGEGAAEQERHTLMVRRRYQDLNIVDLVKTEARRSLERLEAVRPEARAMPVLLGPGTLGDFIGHLVQATSGRAVYLRQSPLIVGEPIAAGKIEGDPLIVELNALFPFGPGSYRIDETGVAGRNVRVIDGGVFATPHADTQYAHYLKLAAATGAPGTPQLPPGTADEAALRKGNHLEVVQFSDLIPSLESGRFSAEIRFGYQTVNGRRRPVTGGTLSGNIRDAFRHVRYSKEVGLHDQYVGPNAALFEKGLTLSV
jgi:PmbA protein